MSKIKTLAVGTSAAAVLISGAILAPAAHASGGGGVTNTGNCSQSSTWKLKAKNDDGALEVEFEVDSNVVGQKWTVRINDNGTLAARGTATTTGPSGSFSFERNIPNQTGRDAITAVAKQAGTGETCRGRVAIG